MEENIEGIPGRYISEVVLAIDAWQPEGKGGIGYQQRYFSENNTPFIGIVSGVRMPLAISDNDTFTMEWELIRAQIQTYCRHYYMTWASIGYLDHPEQWMHVSAEIRRQKKHIQLIWHPEIEDPFYWRQELKADADSLLRAAAQYAIILLNPLAYTIFFEEFPSFGEKLLESRTKLFATIGLENTLFEIGQDSGIKIAFEGTSGACITERLACSWLLKLSKGENLTHILTSIS
jgi:hypothetical protein